MGFRVAVAILTAFFAAGLPAASESHAHWERQSFDGGAELHTLFAVLPGSALGVESESVPIVSILRDTLGDDDPANDRLRYVWLLNDPNEGRWTKWMSPRPALGDMPRPLVDLDAPGKGLWKAILRRVVQTALLDSSGLGVRISSRSYWTGRRASKTARLYEALSVMQETPPRDLDPEERTEALARMLLTESTLGGLAPDEKLERILEQRLGARRQALGRNWELLRQRAEAEGLVFQPVGLDGEQPTGAMLWISRADLDEHWGRPFRSRFLGIADPWKDRSLLEWSEYSESWCFDADGRRSAQEAAVAGCEQMIPLSLYGLDHPKAPFLLVDFRSAWKPALRETARRTIEDIPRTVFGFSSYVNFELRAAQLGVSFVRGRWGAPVQRRDRLRAGAAVRQAALASPQVTPEMRERLTERLGLAGSSSVRRYESLLAWAGSPDGLPKRLEKDRGRELAQLLHPGRARWLGAVTVATAGLYRYREPASPEHLALLDRERRLETAAGVVEEALASSPRVDVGGALDAVRQAARQLASVESVNPSMRKRAGRLLRALVEQPVADEIHRELAALIRGSDSVETPRETLVTGGLD